MTRRYGRSPKGKRLIGRAPFGHWKTTTFIAGLRHDRIVAPFVIDQPMNGEIFLRRVETCLAPTLSPGDIVVMDNLPAHKIAGVGEAIDAAGVELRYLHPYSPDLQSNRNDVRQAESAAAQSGGAHDLCAMGPHRHRARQICSR
jgi:hypothetical protein